MLEKISRYGPLNTHDLFKFAAIMLMLVDHTGLFILPGNLWWRAIGRASAPIWFYFVGRYKPGKFKWDIIIYAIILEAGFWILQGNYERNILLTMVVIRIIIAITDRAEIAKNYGLFFAVFLSACFFPISYHLFEYGSLGLLIAYCGYFQRIGYEKYKTIACFIIATLAYVGIENSDFGFAYPQIIISTLGPAVVMIALYFYHLIPVTRFNGPLAFPIKMVGRYSLETYCAQMLFFLLVNYFFIIKK